MVVSRGCYNSPCYGDHKFIVSWRFKCLTRLEITVFNNWFNLLPTSRNTRLIKG